ncbi:MAG TPA: helix-turn-helix transcriptional regulator [Vicinamibacterales bacterium]
MPTHAGRTRDPRTFLPLTPRVYHVLLALAERPLHGYGVILAVRDLTEGVIVLQTGTLYVLLRRLLDQQLIEETEERPRSDDDDERRRYYRLTELGRAVVEAESLRLQSVVAAARRTLGLRRSGSRSGCGRSGSWCGSRAVKLTTCGLETPRRPSRPCARPRRGVAGSR